MKEKTKEFFNRALFPALWQSLLALMLALSLLMALGTLYGAGAPGWRFVLLPAAVGVACCAASGFMKKPVLQWLLLLLPWLAAVLFANPAEALRGIFYWIDCGLSRWNDLHEAGLALFGLPATAGSVSAAAVWAALALAYLSRVLAERNFSITAALVLCAASMPGLLVGAQSPYAYALGLSAVVGIRTSMRKKAPSEHQLWFCSVMTAVCFLCAAFVPSTELSAATYLREASLQMIHTLRYGEDSLPQGDLYRAAVLNEQEGEALRVSSGREKALYLRGYVGANYRNGVWKPLSDAQYGGEYTGMFEWLKEQNFDPLTQVSRYYALCGMTEKDANRVSVSVSDASRYYLYLPASVETFSGRARQEERDLRFAPNGLFGESSYTVTELSDALPSELTVTASWLQNPQTEEQEQYCLAESVYRNFVYETYTETDPGLSTMMEKLFWEDYDPENDGVYSAVSHVRDRLRVLVSYIQKPATPPEGTDPIRFFLSQTKRGNAALYASAAVEALRHRSIAARYVEGYYLPAGGADDQPLTGKNAHAWIEVYFDGIGWMPVDVTPGYYYDAVTLQQMIARPDAARKNASLDDAKEETVHSHGDEPAEETETPSPAEKGARLLLGAIGLLLLVLTAVFLLAELVRLCVLSAIRFAYRRSDAEGRVHLIREKLFFLLEMWGVTACLGWNISEADVSASQRIPQVRAGEVRRAASLLEKAVYGGKMLEAYEMRTLTNFLQKIAQTDSPITSAMYWKLRYCCLFPHRTKART